MRLRGECGVRPHALQRRRDFSIRVVKPIAFTAHALARMAQRAIAREWVERAVRDPAWIAPDPVQADAQRRCRPIAEFGGRTLRVVVVETDDAIRVITVVFDRGATRRHARHDV